ncbi:MAG: anthranilate phosphoribosyltransferase [Cardiobacteriaceae bacterium]|nr:anthranilate phosphoribosyltransferase [Cardiobacteriaceae bacterium]
MKQAIEQLMRGQNLSPTLMQEAMEKLMSGAVHEAQIGAFLTALSMKGETVEEVLAAVQVMRQLAEPVQLPEGIWVETVGTGGDGAHLFNISTASALLAVSAGAKVAKHGNVGASTATGSADVLRQAGVELQLSAQEVAQCMAETGFGFMFAQRYHQAMKHVVPSRKALGFRTIFNLLGPLANPAPVKRWVLGVFDEKWLMPYAEVVKALGAERALVVHAKDGLDEISVCAETDVVELLPDGTLTRYTLNPRDFGWDYQDKSALVVQNSAESLAMIEWLFKDAKHAPAIAVDMLAINTAAVLRMADLVETWEQGIERAKLMMRGGRAWQVLQKVASVSQQVKGER